MEIQVQGLVKKFDDKQVLRRVDFAVSSGEFVAIIGPSGCGKTTFLKIMAGLIRPDEGTVFINGNGKNLFRFTPSEWRQFRRELAMVFQFSALIDYLTVEENIALPLQRHSGLSRPEIQNRVKELLTLVNLKDAGGLMPSELSGGMKKRVALARALVYPPKIILYDEPVLSLDPFNTEGVMNLLKKIHQEREIISIIATHQIEIIPSLAKRVVLLKSGRLKELNLQNLSPDLLELFTNNRGKEEK